MVLNEEPSVWGHLAPAEKTEVTLPDDGKPWGALMTLQTELPQQWQHQAPDSGEDQTQGTNISLALQTGSAVSLAFSHEATAVRGVGSAGFITTAETLGPHLSFFSVD